LNATLVAPGLVSFSSAGICFFSSTAGRDGGGQVRSEGVVECDQREQSEANKNHPWPRPHGVVLARGTLAVVDTLAVCVWARTAELERIRRCELQTSI